MKIVESKILPASGAQGIVAVVGMVNARLNVDVVVE
jgi:hypothetical protein